MKVQKVNRFLHDVRDEQAIDNLADALYSIGMLVGTGGLVYWVFTHFLF